LEYLNNKQKNLVKGVVDPSIGIGQIYIPKEIINNKINNNDNYSLFITIEKEEKKDIFYEEINMINCFINENEIPIVENLYYYGKINNANKTNRYKLKLDKTNHDIYIQFSANSKKVIFNISTDNTKEIEEIDKQNYDENDKNNDGKKYINLKLKNSNYIYLDIFYENQEINNKLNNYVFKINYGKNNKDKYKIIKNKYNIACTIIKSRKNTKMEIIFNKIENYTNYDIIYSLKIVRKEYLNNGELFKTIALTESNSNITLIKNNDDYDYISYSINVENNFEKNFAYIEVIAQINDKFNNEYIAYEPIRSKEEIKIIKILETTTIFIIIFESLSLIIIICLILFIYFSKKIKKLEQKQLDKKEKIKPLIKYDDILIEENDEEN